MTVARSTLLSLGLALAFISSTAIADTACNKRPVKADRVQVIGRDMIVNGVATSVTSLEFAGSPADVSNEFRKFWTAENVAAKGRSGPGGLLLSALDDTCHYVLIIPSQPATSRTLGLLSVIRLGDDSIRHKLPDSVVSLPTGGKTLSDVESRDPGQVGRTWLIDMSGRASENAKSYGDLLVGQGWAMLSQAPAYQFDGSRKIKGSSVAMQRGTDRLDAIFSDQNGRTQAVVNVIRNR
jgi:hypothetical protein